MFTVHFNKVRQIASNVLSFDLLPKHSIDSKVALVNSVQFCSDFQWPCIGSIDNCMFKPGGPVQSLLITACSSLAALYRVY